MNVCENVIVGAKLFPDRDALVFKGRRWTYARIEDWSSRAAAVLRRHGVQRGDRVALMLPNAPNFVVWYYAALRLGAVAVSISTRLAPTEVAFIVNDCQAKILVAPAGETSANAASSARTSDASPVQASSDEFPPGLRKTIEASELADQFDGQPLADEPALADPVWVDAEPDEPAVILYTSGTTGFPKGATLSHRNVRATVHAFNHLCEMRPGDRMLLAVPLFHCFGQNALLNAGLNVGAALILQTRFDLNESKRLIAEQRVTKLMGVPTTFQLLWECCEPADLATVNYCFSAAATLPIQLSERWREKFGMPIYEGYGLTETAPFASYNHRLAFKPGSIGVPVDLVEMRIVDPETGRPCPPNTPGEIVVRGPNIMLGYWNRPEETAEAIRDGWFHSGDIGKMDDDGYFYIVDRVKDMISIGGMKVFPAEVERVLLDHPAVAEAAVVGFEDAVFGERVVAFVVPAGAPQPSAGESSEHALDQHALHLHCRAHLADFKLPKQYIIIEQLPRNPTGKVLKTKLRERQATTQDHPPVAPHDPSEPGLGAEVAALAAAPIEGSAGDVPTYDSPGPWIGLLLEAHPAARQRLLTSLLQEELQTLLDSEEPPGAEERLLDVGMDSLAIVELRDRLQRHVGSQWELPATLVFDYPRICDLADHFLALLVATEDAGQTGGPSQADGDPASSNGENSAWSRSTEDRRSASYRVAASSPSVQGDAQRLAQEIASLTDQQALEELLRELQEE